MMGSDFFDFHLESPEDDRPTSGGTSRAGNSIQLEAQTDHENDSPGSSPLAGAVAFRKAVETSGEVIFLTDRDGTFTYINPEFTRLYGHTFDEVVGRSTPRILKSGDITDEEYASFWQDLLDGRPVSQIFVNRCKDGHRVTVDGSANPILNDEGEIAGFLAIQRDISQRVQAEAQISRQNKELAALYAITTAVSQSLDLEHIPGLALDEVLRLDMFAGSAKGMLFRLDENKEQLILSAHRGTPRDHPCLARPPKMGECVCGLAAQDGGVIVSEDCWGDRQHSRQWPEMPQHKDICLPLKVRGDLLGVLNLRLPVSYQIEAQEIEFLTSVADQIGVAMENARLFAALSLQHERLRAMSARLTEVEETERRRLARELHDQVGRKMTTLGLNLNIIDSELAGGDVTKVNARLRESKALVEETTRLIRDVMSELRPPMLDDLGLTDTLVWYGKQFASRYGLKVQVSVDEQLDSLPSQIEITLFRIAQEALTNVARHARASMVIINVELDGNIVRMVISDDGIGCNRSQPPKPGSNQRWGLLIMAERAESVGGRCWLDSSPPEPGTRIQVEIPR